jgi:hypothetical protein
LTITAAIERLSPNQGKAFEILDRNLDLWVISNMPKVRYFKKREFVNMVMVTYTTKRVPSNPTMLDMFLIMPVKWRKGMSCIKRRKPCGNPSQWAMRGSNPRPLGVEVIQDQLVSSLIVSANILRIYMCKQQFINIYIKNIMEIRIYSLQIVRNHLLLFFWE